MSKTRLKQLTIIGVGLIGGSLAKDLKKRHYCQKIVGCSRNENNLQRAIELGIIDTYELDLKQAVHDADMILLAVPLGAMENILKTIKFSLKNNVVITDAGSAKQSVINAVERAFGYMPSFFVPAHPIAGREKSGIEAAVENLYVNRKIILTPLENTNKQAIQKVVAMWEVSGAMVETLTVERHDKILAATSHLPHLLAYSLVDTLSRLDESDKAFHYAAGGFRDFTRIASSDPIMWRDICVANRDAILNMIDIFQNDLDELKQKIAASDTYAIFNIFNDAKKARDNYIDGSY